MIKNSFKKFFKTYLQNLDFIIIINIIQYSQYLNK